MEEKGIDNKFKGIEDLIYLNPLPLLEIKSSLIKEGIDNYLPYSCGIEFECLQKSNYNEFNFSIIPNIMSVQTDSSEQRYRIPNGLKGMICLYDICKLMKEQSLLDLSSSNHYHFDFNDVLNMKDGYMYSNSSDFITKENTDYINQELIKWGTVKVINSNWMRFFNQLGTLEIRIGEPTFDYDIIIKRLIDGCRISKYLKNLYYSSNEEKKLLRLQLQLNNLNIEEINKSVPINEVKQQLKSRINKI